MATIRNHYGVVCETEGVQHDVYGTTEPTECPVDSGHTLRRVLVIRQDRRRTTTIAMNEKNKVNASYRVVGRYLYPGSKYIDASIREFIVEMELMAGVTADVRIYDATNNNVIAEKTGISGSGIQLVSLGDVQDVPDNESRFLIEARRASGSGNRNVRIYSLRVDRN